MSATEIMLRHDQNIARLVAKGMNSRQVAKKLGLRLKYVQSCVQGFRQERRLARTAGHKREVGYCGSRVVEALPPVRVDRSASDLARALRANRAALAAFDPSHLVACFHVAGLTLEDIEAGLGIPPVEAVAAIRRAHHGLYP